MKDNKQLIIHCNISKLNIKTINYLLEAIYLRLNQ